MLPEPTATVVAADIAGQTGLAAVSLWPGGAVSAEVATLTSTAVGKGASLQSRLARIGRARAAVTGWCRQFDNVTLAVVEGPAYSSHTSGQWDMAGRWWSIVDQWAEDGLSIGLVPPAALKRWATGRGNADKLAVYGSVSKLWPTVEISNGDEADALVMASMAASWLWPSSFTLPAYRSEALGSAEWPEMVVG